ncbi:hypothetical protein [Chromohalobacter israelensis]|uniref:hypothetical protein n=1 Tax=Chromohalobacter israelensis TaxID=141390 RepID=UPI0006899FF5|nr:hypothetical protein [Chromohalobacter israelensis]MDF9436122.1 hypothetical protein [Chromohalobacter israelensis]
MKAREPQGDGNLAVALSESALYLGSALGASLGGFALALQMPVDTLSIVAGLVALSGMGVQAWLWKRPHARGMACPDS